MSTLLGFYSIWFKYYLLFSNDFTPLRRGNEATALFSTNFRIITSVISSFSLITVLEINLLTCLWTPLCPPSQRPPSFMPSTPFGLQISSISIQPCSNVYQLSKTNLNLYQSLPVIIPPLCSSVRPTENSLFLFIYLLCRPKFASVWPLPPLLQWNCSDQANAHPYFAKLIDLEQVLFHSLKHLTQISTLFFLRPSLPLPFMTPYTLKVVLLLVPPWSPLQVHFSLCISCVGFLHSFTLGLLSTTPAHPHFPHSAASSISMDLVTMYSINEWLHDHSLQFKQSSNIQFQNCVTPGQLFLVMCHQYLKLNIENKIHPLSKMFSALWTPSFSKEYQYQSTWAS